VVSSSSSWSWLFVVGVGRRQWRCAEAGRRAAPPVALGRRTGVMMAMVVLMLTIILSEVLISMLLP